ncbi:MAG: phosphomannomutase, partial [Nitrospirota bacterium]
MPMSLSCFKAYDVRGRVPEELNEELAYNIGRAYSSIIRPGAVVVGRDIRQSSRPISEALQRGIIDSGHMVYDIGLCGTEQVYFSTFHLNAGGGVMVTASHNPADYNGMKFVREQSKPISGDTGLKDIEALVGTLSLQKASPPSPAEKIDTSHAYIEHVISYIDPLSLPPYKVVVNPGNGCAGPIIDMLGARLPVRFVKVNFEPDGSFPNGVPNPLLPENRDATSKAVINSGADIGLAWDGDFDRCFFFDENGKFIEGSYIVGLLAEALLKKNRSTGIGLKIVHDPRLTWNTRDIVESAGGIPVLAHPGRLKDRVLIDELVPHGL